MLNVSGRNKKNDVWREKISFTDIRKEKMNHNIRINNIYEQERKTSLNSWKIVKQLFVQCKIKNVRISKKKKERCDVIIRGEDLKKRQKSK